MESRHSGACLVPCGTGGTAGKKVIEIKRMTILFPGRYMNYREVNEHMHDEYQTAEDTGLFNMILFNYDAWLNGEKLRMTDQTDISNPVLYRGWMLKPEEYKKLYGDLAHRGIHLLTNPEAYANMHLFPNVYPVIKEDTAEMMCFPDGKVDVEMVKQHFDRFMIKDSVKSTKGTEFPAFFNQSVTQEEFDEKMNIFYKYRGDLLTGSICVKEYLNLKRYDGKTNEFRVFYANGQIISVSRNSHQPGDTSELPLKLAEKYGNMKSPYYTIDYAELEDGSWKIIEAGDGGVSGLSSGQDAVAYYKSLYHALAGGVNI